MAKDNKCLLQETKARKEDDKTLPYVATTSFIQVLLPLCLAKP